MAGIRAANGGRRGLARVAGACVVRDHGGIPPPHRRPSLYIPPKKNWTRFNLMVPFSYVRDIGEEEPNGRDARSVS